MAVSFNGRGTHNINRNSATRNNNNNNMPLPFVNMKKYNTTEINKIFQFSF